MGEHPSNNSALYLFEKFEVGVIHLDAARNVVAMNDFARKVLPVGEKQPFDKLVTSFHPERSKPKVNFLLDQASGCPVASSTPMTMIINIPEQVLLIKVTRLGDHLGATTGFVLVFYDVTQVVSQETPAAADLPAPVNLRLNRIPMVANHKVAFVDTQEVLSLERKPKKEREPNEEAAPGSGKALKDVSDIWASPNGRRVFLLSQACVCITFVRKVKGISMRAL